ncbi:HDOD domain-containing protein [Balneatrix alpica]|uniref:HDOD domain-containing protein n=1 Tax=Balneatrix alpica TaxID=75684 RepID=A0ABV5Z794_9GAMM|nr:HDOD domain-containing protein [Balneatrix alpica]
MTTPSALFVDDEIYQLTSLRRGVRLHYRHWNFEFTQRPDHALNLLPQLKPWVVVTDQKMPLQDGTALLSQVARLQPDCIRVLLTGDDSGETAVSASAVAHILIAKPYEIESICEALARALALRAMPLADEYRQLLGGIGILPGLPQTYQKLTEKLEETPADVNAVVEVISHDQAIVAKLLQLANSAFFGFSTVITSINDAVVRLGIDLVKNLVLMLEMHQSSFSEIAADQQESIFKQAFEVAVVAKGLAKRWGLDRQKVEAAFTAGLMHNIGQLVALARGLDLSEWPQDQFPRAMLGAYLLNLWGVDQRLIQAVMYQDAPSQAQEHSELVCCLHAARVIVAARNLGTHPLDEESGLDQETLESLGMLSTISAWLQQENG